MSQVPSSIPGAFQQAECCAVSAAASIVLCRNQCKAANQLKLCVMKPQAQHGPAEQPLVTAGNGSGSPCSVKN
jgi:hypothetical protein